MWRRNLDRQRLACVTREKMLSQAHIALVMIVKRTPELSRAAGACPGEVDAGSPTRTCALQEISARPYLCVYGSARENGKE